MILTNDDIIRIVTKHPNKDVLKSVKDYTDLALMHVKGVGMDAYIQRINQFEPAQLIDTRKKYAVSNKDMFARVLRPLDKVYSAKGGSTYYNLSDSQAEKVKEYCSNVAYGYNVRKWLQTFWMPALAYDPMGLIFMEVDKNGKTYPTYKSAKDVYDYQLKGRELEYVIFDKDPRITKLVQDGKVPTGHAYRVVDDVSDRIVVVQTDQVKEIDGETFPNYFLKVPARIISDIYDPVKGFYISNIDEVIEKADQYLTQGSVKNIFKNYFGFPQSWAYQSACPECMGTKVLQGRECTFCKGTGLKQRQDPSETTYLPIPQTKDQPILAPNVGGFITPDIEGWDKMDGELKLLEDCIFQTLWGTQQIVDAKNETATGKFIDVQPVNDRLNCYSESAESMETFVVDMIGSYYLGTSYKGASITYGKRYLIETPDEIWTKYESARKNGAPTAALDDLYNDYLQARYSANALELQKYTTLAKVEPYKHIIISDLGNRSDVPVDIMMRKLWFSDWVQTLSDPDIILSTPEKLREDFEAYCEEEMSEMTPEPGTPGATPPGDGAAAAQDGNEGEGGKAGAAQKGQKEGAAAEN